MTKKHFIELAKTIKFAKGTPSEFSTAQVKELARFCKFQDGNFNTERFIDFIAGDCGQNGGKV